MLIVPDYRPDAGTLQQPNTRLAAHRIRDRNWQINAAGTTMEAVAGWRYSETENYYGY
ncbi:MAG: hypothetical protein QGG02_13980 [Gammaproteobacteria bacterium]|nr:hypothetical protein [Gammaproteobacteria bacterium]MDP6733403.1 hypothetical protein [Gammaproteobacteria bacterium]|tara:strand:- start:625 stop:798 length:174 start_codon:yes stop_codon:yes gene_type:complete